MDRRPATTITTSRGWTTMMWSSSPPPPLRPRPPRPVVALTPLSSLLLVYGALWIGSSLLTWTSLLRVFSPPPPSRPPRNVPRTSTGKSADIRSSALPSIDEKYTIHDHVLCGGCFFASVHQGNSTCGTILAQQVRATLSLDPTTDALTRVINVLRVTNHSFYAQLMYNAADEAYRQHPMECARCHRHACGRPRHHRHLNDPHSTGDAFHRYDTVAPRIQRATTHYLRSVPARHRFPPDAFADLDSFAAQPNHSYPAREYLFEYNPSIVILPHDQRSPNHNSSHPATHTADAAVYLAVYRVSDIWWCLDKKYSKRMGYPSQRASHLGVALLDRDLRILKDGVFRLPKYTWQDYRVFVLRNARGQPQLYVGSYTFLLPLWLHPPSPAQVGPPRPPAVLEVRSKWPAFATLPTIYLGQGATCVTAFGGQYRGKNLNYFVPVETNHTDWSTAARPGNRTITTPIAVVEHHPPGDDHGRHLVSFVEPVRPMCHQQAIYDSEGDMKSQFPDDSAAALPHPHLQPSFYTLEEVLYGQSLLTDAPPWQFESGGACCLDMTDPRTGVTVHVGISHVKVKAYDAGDLRGLSDDARNTFLDGHVSYLSRFYAFESIMPFRTVSISGHFCWPHSLASDDGNNPYVGQGASMNFLVPANVTSFGACAKIHFVSGLMYKADDPDTIIVAYGVNDCTPRMIEIRTADVRQLLFYGVTMNS